MNNKNDDNILKGLNLIDDAFFAILMQYKDFCKYVLEIILEREIVEIEYQQIQQTIQNLPGYHSVRLDAYIKDIDGIIINVEMQKGYYKDIPKRARYHQGILDVSGLLSGKDGIYSELPYTYVIFITNRDLFGAGRYRYTFQNLCEEIQGLPLGDECSKIILNTRGTVAEGVSDTLIQFLKYIENSTNEAVQNDVKLLKIHDFVNRLKNNKEVEEKYMNLDWWKEKGREEGKELGMEEGKALGLQMGRELGVEEGRELGKELGLQMGRELGVEEGRELGKELGLQMGRELGVEEGRELGRELGIEEGRELGKELGMEEGREEGLAIAKIQPIRNKHNRGLDAGTISEHLEIELSYVLQVIKILEDNPQFTDRQIFEQMR